MKATAIAPSNIALVKYWGKKDEERIIPLNPSISMTLDDGISTKTTVAFSSHHSEDTFFLNGTKQAGMPLKRVSAFLNLVRKKDLCAKVVSSNSFPSAAGIASSASGFAALAAAAAKAAGLDLNERELSALARQGSGSAARSIHGGFVRWEGEHGVQLHDHDFWPALRDVIVLVDTNEKAVSSRVAMQRTVEHSTQFQERMKKVSSILTPVERAVNQNDFPALATIIMNESDDMHACIQEAGIHYLNEISEKIKNIVRKFNGDTLKAAYTFDAGPNAHIITTEQHVDTLKNKLKKFGEIVVSGVGKGVDYSEEHLW